MKFINELGNEIEIKVEKVDGKVSFVNIFITGPESTMTNVLTLQEATILRDILENEL